MGTRSSSDLVAAAKRIKGVAERDQSMLAADVTALLSELIPLLEARHDEGPGEVVIAHLWQHPDCASCRHYRQSFRLPA